LDQHQKFTDNLKVLASIDVDKSHMIRAMKLDIKPITTSGGQVPALETESIKEAVKNSDMMRAMKPKIKFMSVEDKESIDEDVEIEHSIEEFEAEAEETCHPKDLNCGMALPKAMEEADDDNDDIIPEMMEGSTDNEEVKNFYMHALSRISNFDKNI
jgi:hypothetical protein